jgi:tctex1 domain-containing protein 2
METINGAPVIDIFLPTFRMEPGENERFYPSRARAIAEKVAAAELGQDDEPYNDDNAQQAALIISDKVREEVNASIDKSRYKIIVQTVIGQNADQGVRIASRCLWDPTTDNYVSATYTNATCFCNILVFACYTD